MRYHVQLAVAVRSGLDGRSLSDSALMVRIGEHYVRMFHRKDGFVAFGELPLGEQRLIFSYPGYRESSLKVFIKPDETQLEVVTMRPVISAGRVPFVLDAGGFAPDSTVDIAIKKRGMKIIQDDCKEFSLQIRLYGEFSASMLLPVKVIMCDEKFPEICILKNRLENDFWELESPLKYSHPKGTSVYVEQSYTADAKGTVRAMFFEPCEAAVMYEDKLYTVKPGQPHNEWVLPE